MPRAIREILEGPYTVLIKNHLEASVENDPNKWTIWQAIWDSNSFEELAKKCPDPVNTSRMERRLTWRTEVRWAPKKGMDQEGQDLEVNNSTNNRAAVAGAGLADVGVLLKYRLWGLIDSERTRQPVEALFLTGATDLACQ